MAKYTATNNVTGETVTFDWSSKTAPTEQDVEHISDQQRQGRIATKQKIQSVNDSESTWDKIMLSHPVDWALNTAGALGLNQPLENWHPIDSAMKVAEGVKQAVTGQQPHGEPFVENPRTAGVMKVMHGAMNAAGPVLSAAGYAVDAPGMAASMLTGSGASQLTNQGLKDLAPDVSPEVRDALSTGAGLAAGIGMGRAVNKIPGPPEPPPPVPSQVPAVIPKPPEGRMPPGPQTGVNWSQVIDPVKKLPVGPRIVVPPEPPPTTRALPPAEPEVVPPPQFNIANTQRPQIGPGADLPRLAAGRQPGDAIPMPAAPLRMPPAGTFQAQMEAAAQPRQLESGPPMAGSLPSINHQSFDTLDAVVPAQTNLPVKSSSEVSTVSAPAADVDTSVPKEPPPPTQAPPPPAQTPPPPQIQPSQAVKPPQVEAPLPPRAPIKPPLAKGIKGPAEIAAEAMQRAQQPQLQVKPPQIQQPKVVSPQAVETPSEIPKTPETPLSDYRTNRIKQLQESIGQSEDEKDDFTSDVLKKHLAEEEKNAETEKKGTPQQKANLKMRDEVVQRIDELESKEDPSDEEQQELGALYKRLQRIESQRGSFSRKVKGGDKEDTIRDIHFIPAKLRSANQVLRESEIPAVRKIGEQTPRVEDLKHKFVGTYERKSADIISNLNKNQRVQVGQILDQHANPESATGYDPASLKAAIDIRDMLDDVHGMFAKDEVGDPKVGYIKNYLSHIEKKFSGDSDFKDALQDIWNYHTSTLKTLGQGLSLRGKPILRSVLNKEGSSSNLFQNDDIGDPNSQFTEERTGKMKDYELDVKHVLPAYIESAAKAIYDKPWIDQARGLLKQIPDEAQNAKELSKAYLRNYARYDAYPGLENAWNSFTGKAMRTVGRSLLGFDTRLQVLHLSRAMANVYPELPTKYFAQGLYNTIRHPIESYQEAGRMGILPQNIRPWYFKRPMDKVDTVSQFMGLGNVIPEGIAYHGLKAMFQDRGFSPAEASRMAVDKTNDLSMKTSPARAAKLFSDDLSIFKPFTQFKQQIFKIVEQYTKQPLDALKQRDYARLARYITGVGSMIAISKLTRLSTWHLNPMHLATFSSAVYEKLYDILKKAGKGDIVGALEEAGLTAMPGGLSLQHQLKTGPSAYENDTAPSSSHRTSPRSPSMHPRSLRVH